jgi:uncharacterized protein YecE (DUF72 family)
MAPAIHVGTSGWSYDHWREVFYPGKLPRAKWLAFYAQSFATVELNSSFYHLPTEKAFAGWRDGTPEGFLFAVKVSRLITHIKKLRDCSEPVEMFLSRARLVGPKLGPLLYQIPPGVRRDDSLLKAFLLLLPAGLIHVFEFRHESWHTEEVFDALRRHNAGFCIFDMPGLTTPLAVTADFAYVRFHGSSAMYGGCYSDEELGDWAQRIAAATAGLRSVYVYFNNDIEGFATCNALTLRQKLADLVG